MAGGRRREIVGQCARIAHGAPRRAGLEIVRPRHGSPKAIVGDLAYLALAGFVAWGRFVPESFVG
jgi:hypothetical protein